MFHFFQGKIYKEGGITFLIHDFVGIQVFYAGIKSEGDFFLYPFYDDNKKTVTYYAFDTLLQKSLFDKFLKINGIGTKIAFQLSQISQSELNDAINNMDVKFFQSIPGIGPKSAKKILIELKDSIKGDELNSIEVDQTLFKSIIKSMKGLGYESDNIKKVLLTYKEPITKEKIPEIIKRVISQL